MPRSSNLSKENEDVKVGKSAFYTLEFKLEAVRMVKSAQSLAAVPKILGIAEMERDILEKATAYFAKVRQ
ncbi:MAG: hypothetical protein LBE78_04230 [Burkholderiaceae bacterium]|nr:hypothetical protein [Burkholderiaceae bacterium]